MARWAVRSCVLVVVAVLMSAAPASADVCQILVTGSSCGPAGSGTTDPTFDASGALFYHMTQQPVGTGYIDPFLRLQNTGIEQGYNTNDTNYQFDQKMPINYTHDITLGEVPIVTVNGTQYRQFLLDVNESAAINKQNISLDELQIFLRTTSINGGTSNDYNASTEKLGGTSAIYDLDAGGPDNWLVINYALNGGSGNGDLIVYLPNSLFTGASSQYLYLYSKFGVNSSADLGASTSDAGFEEWWVDKSLLRNPPPDSVPEPTGLALLGLGVVAAAYRRTRARRG